MTSREEFDELSEKMKQISDNSQEQLEDFIQLMAKAMSINSDMIRSIYAHSFDPVYFDDFKNFISTTNAGNNDSETGWLDRDGIFYGCSYGCHDEVICATGLHVIDIENAGWIRISYGMHYDVSIHTLSRPSKEQFSFLRSRKIHIPIEVRKLPELVLDKSSD